MQYTSNYYLNGLKNWILSQWFTVDLRDGKLGTLKFIISTAATVDIVDMYPEKRSGNGLNNQIHF